ncbi:MAG: ATP-binding cassette domain-containing protein, partial [Angustibacter sp.]
MTNGPYPGTPESPPGALVECQHLTKTFAADHVLRDINLSCQPGTITGIVGRAGCGKSLLLRLMVGLARPTAGSVRIDDRDYAELPRPAATVGFAFADQQYHPGRTGREHLRGHAQSLGLRDRRVAEVLQLVGLSNVADRRAGGYSATVWHRLGLGLALLTDPGTLILDQAEGGLGEAGRAWLDKLLREFADEGRTIIACARTVAELPSAPDRIALLHAGDLRFIGSLAELQRAGAGPIKTYSATPTALVSALSSAGLDAREQPWGAVVSHSTPAEIEAACQPTGVDVQLEEAPRRSADELIAEILAAPAAESTARPTLDDHPAERHWPMELAAPSPQTEKIPVSRAADSLEAQQPHARLSGPTGADPQLAGPAVAAWGPADSGPTDPSMATESTVDPPESRDLVPDPVVPPEDSRRDAEAEAFFDRWTQPADNDSSAHTWRTDALEQPPEPAQNAPEEELPAVSSPADALDVTSVADTPAATPTTADTDPSTPALLAPTTSDAAEAQPWSTAAGDVAVPETAQSPGFTAQRDESWATQHSSLTEQPPAKPPTEPDTQASPESLPQITTQPAPTQEPPTESPAAEESVPAEIPEAPSEDSPEEPATAGPPTPPDPPSASPAPTPAAPGTSTLDVPQHESRSAEQPAVWTEPA